MSVTKREPVGGWNPDKHSKLFEPGGQTPNVFGTTELTDLMKLLSANAYVTYDDIGRILKTNPSAISRRVQSAITHGLACKFKISDRALGVSLDCQHPCATEIRSLAVAISEIWPLNVQKTCLREAPSRVISSVQRYDLEELLGAQLRTKLLLMLSACGEISILQLTNLLSGRRYSAQRCVDLLETFQLVKSRRVGLRRYLSLNPDFAAAKQLRQLLDRMRKIETSYDAIARLHAIRSTRIVSVI